MDDLFPGNWLPLHLYLRRVVSSSTHSAAPTSQQCSTHNECSTHMACSIMVLLDWFTASECCCCFRNNGSSSWRTRGGATLEISKQMRLHSSDTRNSSGGFCLLLHLSCCMCCRRCLLQSSAAPSPLSSSLSSPCPSQTLLLCHSLSIYITRAPSPPITSKLPVLSSEFLFCRWMIQVGAWQRKWGSIQPSTMVRPLSD